MKPTELHEAVLKADFLQARRLVEAGASVNPRDEEGGTPLMLCCLHDGERWALGAARMLLVHGGRVGLRDGRGRSALVYAVLYERLGMVRMLLQALDHDLTQADGYGWTALRYAFQVDNGPILDLLVKTMKRYGLNSDEETTTTSNHAGQRTCGRSLALLKASRQVSQDGPFNRRVTKYTTPQPRGGVVTLLPYKPLPAGLWEKRASFYNTMKKRETRPEVRKLSNEASNKVNEDYTPGGGEEREGKARGGPKAKPDPPQDWKLALRTLSQTLQHQISPSYRPRAQARPPAPKPRKRTSRLGPSPTVEALRRQQNQRGRKMSLDALSDSLLKDQSASGAFRRRCSLAVLPTIRTGVSGGQRDCSTRLEGRAGGRRGGTGGGWREIPKPLVSIQEGKKKTLKQQS